MAAPMHRETAREKVVNTASEKSVGQVKVCKPQPGSPLNEIVTLPYPSPSLPKVSNRYQWSVSPKICRRDSSDRLLLANNNKWKLL